MADNLTMPFPQEAPTSPTATPTGTGPSSGTTSTGFPSPASANHGYTSAQYVSRHRPVSTMPPSQSTPPPPQPMLRSPVQPPVHSAHSSPYSNDQPHHAYAHQPSQRGPPPNVRPNMSIPNHTGPPTSPVAYSPQGPMSQPDGYPPVNTPRFSTVGPPRPPPVLGGGLPRPMGGHIRPPGPTAYYGSPPIRPMNANPGPTYPTDYTRGRPAPPTFNPRPHPENGHMGPGGPGGPGLGPSLGPMGPRPMRPPPQQSNNRFSTQSLPGWEHEAKQYNSIGPAHHPNIRPPPPASRNEPPSQNGHQRAASAQIQPTYYGQGDPGLDRQGSIASRFTSGNGYPGGPYSPSAGPPPYHHVFPTTPNRHARQQISEIPAPPPPRSVHNLPTEGFYHPIGPLRKLSISDSLDGGRISLDSTASFESGFANRQPALYPVPNMYGRDSDTSMDAFPPNRQRSASKSSTYSGHSVNSDYYIGFDSDAAPRSATPNGPSTPQISIQSAQHTYGRRTDPFSMRARTPSPGRSRQGSNPPPANRSGNDNIVSLLWTMTT